MARPARIPLDGIAGRDITSQLHPTANPREFAMHDVAPKLGGAAPGHVPGRGRIYASITDTIGDTPIVRRYRLPQL